MDRPQHPMDRARWIAARFEVEVEGRHLVLGEHRISLPFLDDLGDLEMYEWIRDAIELLRAAALPVPDSL
jgi:hypothetical protein